MHNHDSPFMRSQDPRGSQSLSRGVLRLRVAEQLWCRHHCGDVPGDSRHEDTWIWLFAKNGPRTTKKKTSFILDARMNNTITKNNNNITSLNFHYEFQHLKAMHDGKATSTSSGIWSDHNHYHHLYIYIYISWTTVVANVEQSLSSWLNLEAASEVGWSCLT